MGREGEGTAVHGFHRSGRRRAREAGGGKEGAVYCSALVREIQPKRAITGPERDDMRGEGNVK